MTQAGWLHRRSRSTLICRVPTRSLLGSACPGHRPLPSSAKHNLHRLCLPAPARSRQGQHLPVTQGSAWAPLPSPCPSRPFRARVLHRGPLADIAHRARRSEALQHALHIGNAATAHVLGPRPWPSTQQPPGVGTSHSSLGTAWHLARVSAPAAAACAAPSTEGLRR